MLSSGHDTFAASIKLIFSLFLVRFSFVRVDPGFSFALTHCRRDIQILTMDHMVELK